jgi:hypothetical protein
MQEDLASTWGALLKVHASLVPRLDRELQEIHGLPLTGTTSCSSSTARLGGGSPWVSSARSPL